MVENYFIGMDGEDYKTLSGVDKDSHLRNLLLGIEKAAYILGQKLERPDQTVAKFFNLILSNLLLLDYERSQKRIIGTDNYEKMVIDPSKSGLPNFEWMMSSLYGEKGIVEKTIENIPDSERIVKSAKRTVLVGRELTKEQEAMAKLQFYLKLKDTPLIPAVFTNVNNLEGMLNQDIMNRVDSSETVYEVVSFGRDNIENVYSLSRIMLAVDKSIGKLTDENPLVNKIKDFCLSQDSMYSFTTIANNFANVRPLMVEKYVLGPFYSKYTQNEDSLNEVFSKFDSPFLLLFNKEFVFSRNTQIIHKKQFMKKDENIKLEIPSELMTENYGVCTFELKEEIEKRFSGLGEQITIFGVTQGGEVYGGHNNNSK